MTPRIELIFDGDCPNVAQWRALLASAVAELGLTPHWQEWDRADPGAPAYAATLGSPSVLANGHDLFPAAATSGSACRLYRDPHKGAVGVPSYDTILAALRAALDTPRTVPMGGGASHMGGPAPAD